MSDRDDLAKILHDACTDYWQDDVDGTTRGMYLAEADRAISAGFVRHPSAPAEGVPITEDMVRVAEIAYVREITRQIDEGGPEAYERKPAIRLALAAALKARGPA